MCPDKNHISTYQSQRGFLLPLALFILVVMGVLALTISRTSTQTQTSSIQELTNIQAFYAAESGAQRGMQRLFLDTTTPLITRTAVNARCANWSQTFTNINGLNACSAQVSCLFTIDNDDIRSFYTVTSVGRCGPNQYRAERTIEVGSTMEAQ